MFINFSNHPSEHWNKRQREASLVYGELVDLSFPQIAPSATTEELQALAQEWVQKILKLRSEHDTTVHIMGEMTFTFMVVTELKAMGIKCVASTTKRKVNYNDDGTKSSEFQFVKFREY